VAPEPAGATHTSQRYEMKRMLFGLCAAFLAVMLHAAPASADNIVWATLADEACSQSHYDLYVKVMSPGYYNEWVQYIQTDHEVYAFFESVDGDLYVTFMEATSVMFAC
jgi:hypothetical protein